MNLSKTCATFEITTIEKVLWKSGSFFRWMPRFSVIAQIWATVSLLLLLFVFAENASAQTGDPELPPDVVPPPLNLITKKEKADLEATTKIKDRTKLALGMMDARLASSEEFIGKKDYEESLSQLGRFQALLRNTFSYLKNHESEKSSLKNFKRFEITLRDFVPRLELVRRGMPFKYGYHVKNMIKFVRDARSNSLEPLFDDTVLPEDGN